jgi:energy-coupling factor transport system ATP-binding protein
VNGLDVVHSKNSLELVKNVGYVFQNPDHQLFNNNVYDEIAYAPRNLALSKEEVDERVRTAAQIAGVDQGLFQEHPFFLMKGIRQRIAIASILSLKPKVIIVDEPTTGQDFKQSIEVMEFLKMLNEKQGHTIIIITHEMDIVAEYAKQVVVMNAGRLVTQGTVKEVFSQPDKLREANIKPPQITRLAQALSVYGFSNNAVDPVELFDEWQAKAGSGA